MKSTIYLFDDIDFSNNYANVIDFTSEEEQTNYFMSKVKKTIENVLFDKFHLKLDLSIPNEHIMFYKSMNYLGVKFDNDTVIRYYFIDDCDIVSYNDETITVRYSIEEDYWQNYHMKMRIMPSNIERMHVDRWNKNSTLPVFVTPSREAFNLIRLKKTVAKFGPQSDLLIFDKYPSHNQKVSIGTVFVSIIDTSDDYNSLKIYAFPIDLNEKVVINDSIEPSGMVPVDFTTGKPLTEHSSITIGTYHFPSLSDCFNGKLAQMMDIPPENIISIQILSMPYFNYKICKFKDISNVNSSHNLLICLSGNDELHKKSFNKLGFTKVETLENDVLKCYIYDISGTNMYKEICNEIYYKRKLPKGTSVDLALIKLESFDDPIGDNLYDKLIDIKLDYSKPIKPNLGDTFDKKYEPALYQAPFIQRFICDINGAQLMEIPDNITFTKDKLNIYVGFEFDFVSAKVRMSIDDEDVHKASITGASILVPIGTGTVYSDKWLTYKITSRDTDRAILNNNILNQSAQSVISAGLGGGLVGARGNAPMSVASGTFVGMGAGLISAGVNGYFSLKNQDMKEQAIKNSTSSLLSQGCGQNNLGLDNIAYGFVETICDDVNYNRFAYMFHRYGYAIDAPMDIDIRSRYYFNYIKTRGADIEGTISNKAKEILRLIFDNGVTIWHADSGITIGDYSKENIERCLL